MSEYPILVNEYFRIDFIKEVSWYYWQVDHLEKDGTWVKQEIFPSRAKAEAYIEQRMV